jgi:hypothetical protein
MSNFFDSALKISPSEKALLDEKIQAEKNPRVPPVIGPPEVMQQVGDESTTSLFKDRSQQKTIERFTPKNWNLGNSVSSMGAGWDALGLNQTDSAEYGNAAIRGFLLNNPRALDRIIAEQEEGTAFQIARKYGVTSKEPIEYLKALADEGLFTFPKEIYDPEEKKQIRKDEPTRFDVEQDRINSLLVSAESLNIPGTTKTRVNTETTPVTFGERYTLGRLSNQADRIAFLENAENEDGSPKYEEVLRFPIEMDPDTGEPVEYDLLVAPKYNGTVFRVDPYGQEAAARTGGLDSLSKVLKKLVTGDEETARDLADGLGAVFNVQNLGGTAAMYTVPGGAGASLFKRFLLGLTRSGAVGSGDYLGQFLDKLSVLSEEEQSEGDLGQSFMAAGLELFGKPFMDVLRYRGKYFQQLLTKGTGAEGAAKFKAAETFGVKMSPAFLANDEMAQKFIAQAARLQGEKFQAAYKKLSSKLIQGIRDRISSYGGLGNAAADNRITPADLAKLVESERRDLQTAILDNPTVGFSEVVKEGTDPEIAFGMPQADLAFRAFQRLKTDTQTLRNVFFDKIFKSNPTASFKFDLSPLKQAIRDAREGTPVSVETPPRGTGIFGADEVEILTTDLGKRPAEGTIPGSIDNVLDLLDEVVIDGPVSNTTGKEFGALEQLHRLRINLKQSIFSASEGKDASLVARLSEVERQLDDVFESALDQAPDGARELFALANNTSRLVADTFKSSYIASAMIEGQPQAYRTLIEDLVNGKQRLDAPTRNLLKNLKESLVVMSKEAPPALRRSILAETAVIKDNISNGVLTSLSSEGGTFLTKLSKLTGLDLNEPSDIPKLLDNPAMKFLFPEEKIKQLVSLAASNLRREKDLAVAAANNITEEASSRDIIETLTSSIPDNLVDAGSERIVQIFNKIPGGAEKTRPQVQRFFLQKILDDSLVEDPLKGGKVELLDLGQARTAIESLRSKNPKLSKVFSWAFDGDENAIKIIDDLAVISGNLSKLVAESSGESIQVADVTAKLSGAAGLPGMLSAYKRLLTSRILINSATNPVTMEQWKKYTADASRGSGFYTTKELTNFFLRLQARDNPLNFFYQKPAEEGDDFVPVTKLINESERRYFKPRGGFNTSPSDSGGYLRKLIDRIPKGIQGILGSAEPVTPPSTQTVSSGIANLPNNRTNYTSANQGGIARLPQRLAMLENLGVPLFGNTG